MISIIIPLYNKVNSIQGTLDSILSQEFQGNEVVIVDDGSTDNGQQVVSRIQDSRIRLIRQENGGVSRARNIGVENAKGDWVLFLDADDTLEPDAIRTISEDIRKRGKNVDVFTYNLYISKNGEKHLFKLSHTKGFLPFPFMNYYLNEIYPRTGNMVIRRSVMLHEKYNERFRRHEDSENTFRIMRHYRFYASVVPVFTYNLNTLEGSKRKKNIEEDFCCMMEPEGKPLFEQMVLYKLYREDTCYTYPELAEGLYKGRFNINRIKRWDKILNTWVRMKGRMRKILLR